MDWLDKMNNALDYVEECLAGVMDYEKIAQKACCSVYHFQRTFTFITNLTLSEYIRRRRMTLAAFELQQKDVKIVDLAFKYGYGSPEAFSRAFKALHGVSPAYACNENVSIKSFPRISFQISIRGEKGMDYRIETKDSFGMFGVTTTISANECKPFVEIPEFWKKCIIDGSVENIHKVAEIAGDILIHGALYDFSDSGFSYMVGYTAPTRKIPDNYSVLEIPRLTWAIFSTGEITDNKLDVKGIWTRIWSEWFPSSNYQTAEGPQLEMFYNKGEGKFEYEVWIPIKPK